VPQTDPENRQIELTNNAFANAKIMIIDRRPRPWRDEDSVKIAGDDVVKIVVVGKYGRNKFKNLRSELK